MHTITPSPPSQQCSTTKPTMFFLCRRLPTPCQFSCFSIVGSFLSFPDTSILLPAAILQREQPYTHLCSCSPHPAPPASPSLLLPTINHASLNFMASAGDFTLIQDLLTQVQSLTLQIAELSSSSTAIKPTNIDSTSPLPTLVSTMIIPANITTPTNHIPTLENKMHLFLSPNSQHFNSLHVHHPPHPLLIPLQQPLPCFNTSPFIIAPAPPLSLTST